jgi:signal transduction histidine kinase
MTQRREVAQGGGRSEETSAKPDSDEGLGNQREFVHNSDPQVERRVSVGDRRSPHGERRGRVLDRRGLFTDRRRATEVRYRAPSDSELQEKLSAWQESTRGRIAADLHDSIGSSLCTIRLKLQDAASRLPDESAQASAASLSEIVSDVSRAMDEVRRIAMDLRPAILDDLGIVATIGWLTRDLQSSQNEIEIEKHIEVEEERIPDSIKTAIFRIVQEGLNNVIKHSGARFARVTLREDERELRLMVEDDGKGFEISSVLDKLNADQHYGVASMRHRANGSGGILMIKSESGVGTTISCAWPRRER